MIPKKIDYDSVSGLSNEIKRKLKEIRPLTFGQALRIDGVTPAAINILMIYCKNTFRKAS
jgi:tRNA uridine 5-carboxymethylaminomethyl modification enzyme